MSSWDRDLNWGFRGWTLVAAVAALVVLAWVVFLGTRIHDDPPRCATHFEPMKARCCAPGQGLSAGQCVGVPEKCPTPFILVKSPSPGCAYPNEQVQIPGGSVTIGPTDWDSVDVVAKRIVKVLPFIIDKTEVTYHRYEECVGANMCTSLASGIEVEPGLPVTGVTAQAAQSFCAFKGGRLPTPSEWLYAASGSEGRRFPWGAHGLVCRRATFGLVKGPCANHGIMPDLAGMRPSGATPEGLLDMSGNAAEWAMTPEGNPSVHGGSFRSRNARELKVWSSRASTRADDVGFRCAYPPGL